jgi:hypothetical protein
MSMAPLEKYLHLRVTREGRRITLGISGAHEPPPATSLA